MLKKFGSMGQSLRDVTKSYATKAAAKINELQTLPQEIPENWDERIDENGKPYYVDTVTGEWYRVRAKQHKRIDTNEKISILTAESKKEFDDQKDKMLDEDGSLSESYSDNDLPSDTPPDDTNTKGGTPNGNGHTNANTNEHETKRTRAKSNHSKRSSTSVSQGWQCGQCTLENVGNAQTCNACLAPRPERPDEDEDELAINSGIQAMEERVTQGSTDDDLLSVEDRQHQQQSTMDAINSAMTESLDALGGDEIKGLTEEQRTQLLMFMDCVETEPEPSIKYLRGSNWDLEHAIETYFQQHPDHPKSRGGSLQFDLSQLHDIYAEDMDFEADVQLPDDIVHKTKAAAASGRRDSTELDELPNGDGHGARESDNEDHDSDSDKQISYEPMQASGMYDDASAYGSHRRMNTDQQMAVAEQLSVQQSDFDVQLDKYRKEVEALKAELKEQYEENDRLKVENEELQIEKDRYAIQSREIQNDWDRMSGYMGQILGEVAFIEECRKKGEDISTPTPKLNNIFQAIQHTISRNNNEEMNEEEEDEMMNMMDNTQQMNEVSDIYENVADLFTEEAPVVMEKTPLEANPNKNRKRKLSFGAVNELFAGGPPIIDDDGEVHMPEPAPNNFLSVVGGHGDDDKRLSYGGVGLLFDTQDDGDKEEEETKEEEEEIEMDALNINFKPTYEGIASLFDESENVLSDTAHNKGKPSFAGDIVELFKSPHDDDDDEDDEDSGSGSEAQSPPPPEDEEESTDSMDKQRVYTYASSDDIDGEDEEDGDEAKEESKHNRRESYASNLSDPTPLSRRGSTSGKRHTRGPSFAFKDLFRGDDENDSEDRAPSVQSAPEEHDYYAITAYYGIEDDDGTGWDSRRSSLFGDYGRVHSRRQSKRVQSQMVGDNIRDMFKVDLSNKLTQHLSASAMAGDGAAHRESDNVADLFYDDEKQNVDKMKSISEDVDAEEVDITDNAHVVADLFETDQTDAAAGSGVTGHKKKDTYSGVKQLFGKQASHDEDEDDSEEEEDYDDVDMEKMRLNAAIGKVPPRPSTAAALGSTFDSISMSLRVPHPIKKEKEVSVPDPVVHVEDTNNDDDEREERIREEERAKLTVIEEELKDKYENEMRDARRQIEEETDVRLRNELTQSLSASLTQQLSADLRMNIESEMQSQMESKMNSRISEKVNEMAAGFDEKMKTLKEEMDEREDVFRQEMKTMEHSKCELIQHTAKEIDSLRNIIKDYFDQIQTLHNNIEAHRANAHSSAAGNMLSTLFNNYKWG